MTDDTMEPRKDPTIHDVESAAHRAACAECSLVWADLERISMEAAALPLLSPSRDLWADIDARLGATAFVSPSIRFVRLATAASLLIAATAAVTWTIARGGSMTIPSPAASVAIGSVDEVPAATPVQQASLNATVATMDREIAELEAILDERRATLDPRTIAVLEENMKLIDDAIAESQKALDSDPASRFLVTQYTRAYNSKLTLLRGATTLPAGT